MINQAHDADLKNNGNEIKVFLIKEFGDFIPFCDPERKIQSLFDFSSSIEVQSVINSLQKNSKNSKNSCNWDKKIITWY